jgi:hypothetical protein
LALWSNSGLAGVFSPDPSGLCYLNRLLPVSDTV